MGSELAAASEGGGEETGRAGGEHEVLVSDRFEITFYSRGIYPRLCLENCNWKVIFQKCERNEKQTPKARGKTRCFWLPNFTPPGKPALTFPSMFSVIC